MDDAKAESALLLEVFDAKGSQVDAEVLLHGVRNQPGWMRTGPDGRLRIPRRDPPISAIWIKAAGLADYNLDSSVEPRLASGDGLDVVRVRMQPSGSLHVTIVSTRSEPCPYELFWVRFCGAGGMPDAKAPSKELGQWGGQRDGYTDNSGSVLVDGLYAGWWEISGAATWRGMEGMSDRIQVQVFLEQTTSAVVVFEDSWKPLAEGTVVLPADARPDYDYTIANYELRDGDQGNKSDIFVDGKFFVRVPENGSRSVRVEQVGGQELVSQWFTVSHGKDNYAPILQMAARQSR